MATTLGEDPTLQGSCLPAPAETTWQDGPLAQPEGTTRHLPVPPGDAIAIPLSHCFRCLQDEVVRAPVRRIITFWHALNRHAWA